MRRQIGLLLLLPSFVYAACDSLGDEAAAAAIAQQRTAFNRAIADADIDIVASVLHPDVILITGTDSDVFVGRDAQVDIWAGDFDKDDRAIYVRTTECVRVSARFPVALETGAWVGTTPAKDRATGTYAAKWRKVDDAWLLESEIFMTEECAGRFCPEE